MNKLSRRFSGNWAKLLPNKRQRQQQRRRLMAEPLEDRRLLAVDFNILHNYEFPTDVNGDGSVSPIDALIGINYINGASGVANGEDQVSASHMKPDVNGDGVVSPLDVLNVINQLAEGEPGNVVTFSHQATDLEGNVVTNVSVGETFILQTLVQDMRSSPQGVFAAYFDLDYDESLVRVNQRESQTLQFSETPTGGTYQLTFNGQTTSPITFADRNNAFPAPFNTDANIVGLLNATRINTALQGLSNINLGDAEVVPFTGGTVNGGTKFNYEVKFGGQYAGVDVPKLVPTNVQLTNAASNPNTPTITVFNTSDELLVPSLEELQQDNPNTTPADRANLVARSEAVRSFTFAFPKFSSGQSGRLGVLPPGNTNMIVDEIGAFTSNQTPGGGDLEVLVEIQLTALAGGTATFLGNPSDQSPDHDVLVFGIDNAISTADIGFMPIDITIASDIIAAPDSATVEENGGPVFIDVLANDSITVGVGPTITSPIPTTSAEGGTVAQATVQGVNGFNYTPAPNFNGTDTFDYTITNGSATASATVTVTVTEPVVDNRPIISGPNTLNTNEDTPFTLSGFNITDADSTNITVTLTANGGLSQTNFSGTPAQVTSTLNSITYTPITNSNAADTLNISASDGALTGTKNVNITINPVNDPPVFANLPTSLTAFLNQTLAVPSFTVTDPDSALTVTLSVTQGTLSNNGTTGQSVTINGGPGTVTVGGVSYTPPAGLTGSAGNLTVRVAEGTGTPVSQAPIPITVIPPLLPFAAPDSITISEGTASGSVDVLANDLAKSARANLSITATSLPIPTAQGSVTQNGSTFTYSPPDPDFFGTTSFTYTIEDSGDAGDGPNTGTVNITVTAVNDPPIIIKPTSTPTFAEDSLPMSISGLSVTDIDNATVNVSLSVANGTLNAGGPGGPSGSTIQVLNTALSGLTYRPNANYFGPDTLNISANDGIAPAVTDTVNITIQPINDPPTIVVPGKQTFFTDFDNTFSSIPAPFSIADIDAGNNNVQVDLTIGVGTLTISPTSGVTVTPNPTGNSNSIRLTGSVTSINNALASGVVYRTSTPTPSNTPRQLTATVNDLGNTGTLDPNLSGAAQVSASKTVDVEVLDFVPINIIGKVFIDHNADGNRNIGEPEIGGVSVFLNGTDFQGNTVNLTATTDAHGNYKFNALRPTGSAPYTVTREQPVFIRSSATNQASLNLDVRGNVSVTGGSLNFGVGGFTPEYADVWDLFALSDVAPHNSGILFGIQGTQKWSIFAGSGWDLNHYSNPRFTPGADRDSGVLTVFDSTAGVNRTVNVSTQAGTLTYRGNGTDRVYRVIGGSSLLGGLSNGANPEAESGATTGDATTSGEVFAQGVDALFASGGL